MFLIVFLKHFWLQDDHLKNRVHFFLLPGNTIFVIISVDAWIQ